MENNMGNVIKVGIADLKIARSPDKLRTTGLGSCVGVVVYDLTKQIAGLAHIMLPDSQIMKKPGLNLMKYADSAMENLIELLISNGACKSALLAKMAGGAQMFKTSSTSEIMRIGPRNIEAVEKKLVDFHIKLIASDVGGNCGRTIEFNPSSGQLHIRTVSRGEKVI